MKTYLFTNHRGRWYQEPVIASCAPGQSGRYRLLNRKEQLVNDYLALAHLDLFLFEEYPERIYLYCK